MPGNFFLENTASIPIAALEKKKKNPKMYKSIFQQNAGIFHKLSGKNFLEHLYTEGYLLAEKDKQPAKKLCQS